MVKGAYIQSEGRKYVGEYKNGLKNGLGALTYGKGNGKETNMWGNSRKGKT